ncbi:MAG: hypothetical protein RL662_944 [Bacteroidota bacterium]|jgi:small-conductance mechanosensitive channel
MEKYFIQIIATGVLILTLPVVKFIVRKIIRKYVGVSVKFDNRTNQIRRIFSICINLVFIIGVIIIWGVDPRNLLVALSSIFAVIGVALFAQWSILSNVTAGIIIFFTAPFKVGDYIRILDKDMPFEALVEDILTFYTILRTRDGEEVSYPNSLFLQKGISVIRIHKWDEEI